MDEITDGGINGITQGWKLNHGTYPEKLRRGYVIQKGLAMTTTGWKIGIVVRLGSVWVGCHYSPKHKRACFNLIPFVTIWICRPGGETPTKEY